jgi:hypothetical protein
MALWRWIANNWFDLLSSLGIIGGLWFTAISLHSETKTRRVENLFSAIQNHRELWNDFYRRPELSRVLDASADVVKHPPTREEEGFVKLVIQHTNSVYQAIQNGLVIEPEGVRRDVCSFFSLPIPNAVWGNVKILQNNDFVIFVESCRNWK